MQSIKVVLREIGMTQNALTPEDLDEYLRYNYTSKGYKLAYSNSFEMYNDARAFVGLRMVFVFTKDE